MVYAGFWKRFCAGIIDFFVLVPFIALQWWLYSISKTAAIVLTLPFAFLYSLYTVSFHAKWGQTLGKMALQIKVVTLEGKPIAWREALLRSSVDLIFAVISTVGLIIAISNIPEGKYYTLGILHRVEEISKSMPPFQQWTTTLSSIWVWSECIVLLFNVKKRAIHDFIAGTVVIRQDQSAVFNELQSSSENALRTTKHNLKYLLLAGILVISLSLIFVRSIHKREGICKTYNWLGWSEGNYKDGKREGIYKKYYISGTLEEIGNYKDDKMEGIIKKYYESGKLKVESNFKDDKVEGMSKFYYENGKLQMESNFKDGKMEGISKMYGESGKLEGESNFKDYKNAKEAVICYLEGLEKVNHIKSKPKSVIKEIEVHV